MKFFSLLKPAAGLVILFILISPVIFAQDDLLAELQEAQPERKQFALATFKGSRAVNGHSVETKGEGELELIISHRFGRLNTGSYNFWGLDQAYIRIGLEYGITDNLNVGVGRNSYNKIYDSYLKYRVVRQSKGPGSFPFTVTAFASTGIQTYPQKQYDSTLTFLNRATYTYQLLIARKFSSRLSLQLSPTVVHSNRVDQTIKNNDLYALGIAGRYKITRSLAISSEYFYRYDPHHATPYNNAFSIGFDLETGGHVFQMILSNTQGMVERTFITETEGDFFKGDIHFGFNITRTFQLKDVKK